MWQGLRTISTFGGRPTAAVSADSSLADELNTFYACLETNCSSATASLQTSTGEINSCVRDEHAITVSEDEVRKALKHETSGTSVANYEVF